ncbi:Alpha amylase, catalytic domain [Candidatus Electronema aureum]
MREIRHVAKLERLAPEQKQPMIAAAEDTRLKLNDVLNPDGVLKLTGRWQLPAPTEEYRPSWLMGAVIYSIFVDRWWRGAHSPPYHRATPRDAPSTPDTIYGGDLYGVEEALSWIADLGVDAIVLTPIHTAESPHRYDAVCFETVDPRLGGEKTLAALLNACHMHGLRLILDAAFTHCHCCTNHAFQDLLQNQAQSKYREWFFVNHFPFSVSDPDSYRFYPAHPDLPLLNLAAAPVLSFFERLVESWMRLGVDGLRFDAVEFAPPDTWKSLGVCARKVNPDVALIAECVFESPAWAVEQLGVHCATDYTRYELIVKS